MNEHIELDATGNKVNILIELPKLVAVPTTISDVREGARWLLEVYPELEILIVGDTECPDEEIKKIALDTAMTVAVAQASQLEGGLHAGLTALVKNWVAISCEQIITEALVLWATKSGMSTEEEAREDIEKAKVSSGSDFDVEERQNPVEYSPEIEDYAWNNHNCTFNEKDLGFLNALKLAMAGPEDSGNIPEQQDECNKASSHEIYANCAMCGERISAEEEPVPVEPEATAESLPETFRDLISLFERKYSSTAIVEAICYAEQFLTEDKGNGYDVNDIYLVSRQHLESNS